ncbi:MAG: beta-lactamase family protein, partial [Alphaproteobacteria bacterium]|nr:beta-lactamase family protein [Alphaproteobacteria bacterium]
MRIVTACRTLIAAVALISWPTLAQQTEAAEPAPPEALERLDAYAQALTAADLFSGVVLVANNGEVVFERAYGMRDESSEDALKVDARFDIASAGKMFTATAALQQIAAGKLTLDTTLGEVLPDYPDAAMREATIYQLLTHSAGAGETDALFYPDSLVWHGTEPSVADLVGLYDARDPTFVPGSGQEYSNHTMTLLGRVVEVLSGQDYRSYIAEHIFEPAGMDAAHANDACDPDDPAQAIGYVTVADERMPNCFATLDGGWPAGGQSFSAQDLLRFVSALREERLGVPRSLFEQATTPKLSFI